MQRLILFFHMFKRLSIFSGRDAHIFVEHGVQMAGAAEAKGICNVTNGNIRIHQKSLCLADAALHRVLNRRHSEFIFKGMGQILGIDVQVSADLLQGQCLPVMLVQITAYPVGCGGGRSPCADDGIAFPALQKLISEQQKGDGKGGTGLTQCLGIIGQQINQPEHFAYLLLQQPAGQDRAHIRLTQGIVLQSKQCDMGNAHTVGTDLPGIRWVFPMQYAGIADDDVTLPNIVGVPVNHISSCTAVDIKQLQEIIMNVGQPGMPVAVFLIDEVADMKLRNIVTAKMIGKGMNGMHKSHLLSCGFIIR